LLLIIVIPGRNKRNITNKQKFLKEMIVTGTQSENTSEDKERLELRNPLVTEK